MQRLIVTADGTWGTDTPKPPGTVSNVVIVRDALLTTAPEGTHQERFYDPGVGTGAGFLDKYLGGLFGIGLSQNVVDCYTFLAAHYRPGDEIYMFGFSRGAFTVRSAAGMIRKVGLVRREYASSITRAYDIYRSRTDEDVISPDTKAACEFRERYSEWPVRIKFIGVWDTVGSLGVPVRPLSFINPLSADRFAFHDANLSRTVDFAYHALAIDERRGPFRPTLWQQHPEAEGQVMEQQWFPGVHCDVGGGYERTGLSNIALHWIVEKAKAVGLAFDDDILDDYTADCFAPLHHSRTFPFTLLAPYDRPIDEGRRTNETLHPATFDRCRQFPAYPRQILRAYLDRYAKDHEFN